MIANLGHVPEKIAITFRKRCVHTGNHFLTSFKAKVDHGRSRAVIPSSLNMQCAPLVTVFCTSNKHYHKTIQKGFARDRGLSSSQ